MNLIDYLLYVPYKVLWHVLNLFKKREDIIFYCADPLDYEMFLPVAKHLSFPVRIIAANRKTRRYLKEKGLPFGRPPVFPRAVIMARHAAYKFPVKKIVKLGFDHGLYQFKRWTSAKYYNRFDVYFVSSSQQMKTALQKGINSTQAVGYPKLDKAFDGSITSEYLVDLGRQIGLDPAKKTVLFSTTWDVDGLSAIRRWVDRVHELTGQYNILLTAHTWTKSEFIHKLRHVPKAYFIEAFDITEYLMLSDVFVGDYNSLIGEYCALDKPIITFRTNAGTRAIPEVRKLIAEISVQVEDFNQIPKAIERCLENPNEKQEQRRRANRIFYYKLDGQAGKRAAQIIEETIGHNR